MTKRRLVASARKIEETIAAGQNRGLVCTSVSHEPCGRTVVHFGGDVEVETDDINKGWEDY